MIRFGIAPAAALTLAGVVAAGCAGQPRSYVAGVETGADAAAVAAGVADMVAAKVRPSAAAVALVPTPAGQADNRVTPALTDVLRGRGFALADKPGATGHSVRYSVVPIKGAVLVGAAVDGWNMARPYARVPGGALAPAGPVSVEAPAMGIAGAMPEEVTP